MEPVPFFNCQPQVSRLCFEYAKTDPESLPLSILSTPISSTQLVLEPPDNQRLANLCGQLDEHLRQIERSIGVEISNRGNIFHLLGDRSSVQATEEILRDLYQETRDDVLTPARVHLYLQESGVEALAKQDKAEPPEVTIRLKRGVIKGRGPNQQRYLQNVLHHDVNFGVGPAGTGKTYLAVACAVDALEKDQVRRIILVRPAVEAGERLGFLPGDLSQKIDPYLRPLFDALYEMLGIEKVNKLIERNVIEVAPLAYMRGRTLNDSFVILDEAQNTTIEQMKMFLTRIGFGSTAVITGDITQVDLPRGKASGLRHVLEILKNVDGISFTFFRSKDVVRHPLVARIVDAYDQHESNVRPIESGKKDGD
jgi:phosphate starvation-inducible PhoH-like protein